MATRTFTVASYNIHRCIGSDGRKDPSRIAEVLRELSCDVIGLQEVESHGPRGGDAHQLDYLASDAGYEAVAGPTMRQPEGHYGNALLTRARVLDVSRHVLESSPREPRGALEAILDIHGCRVQTIVTHLGLRPGERRLQLAQLMSLVRPDGRAPSVLAGDFNEWFPWARSRRQLRERFGDFPTPATFPAKWPLFGLDHVCVHPPSALRELEAVRSRLSRTASDHLPVRVTVSLESR